MNQEAYKENVQRNLDQIDVQNNGPDSWDIQVNDPRLYKRVLAEGSLALESPTWTNGGMLRVWTSFFTGFTVPTAAKSMSRPGKLFGIGCKTISSICNPGKGPAESPKRTMIR